MKTWRQYKKTKHMVIEYIRYQVDTAQREDFMAAYTTASSLLQRSVYCLGYELSECEEQPGSFILRIEWTTTDDHVNGFRKSTDFPAFFALVKPFFNQIQEMRHYHPTAVVKRAVEFREQ